MMEFFADTRIKEKDTLLNALGNSINTFVFGPHGIGKTALIKDIAEEYSSKIGRALTARTGLEIVRKAGKKAEVRYLNEVTMRELEETITETNKLKMVYPVDKLNEHQKAIYDILEKKRKLSSGLLYDEYCTLMKSPVVDRAYRNYMQRMVNLGLIKSEGKGRWKRYEIVA